MVCLCRFDLLALFFSFGNLKLFQFKGGPQEFICGNEISFEVAIESYSKSTRTGIQFSLAMFLNTFSLSCWALSAFNTICVIARFKLAHSSIF